MSPTLTGHPRSARVIPARTAVALVLAALAVTAVGPPPAPASALTDGVTASVTTATPLSWAPPELTDPITVQVSDARRDLRLDTTRDYIVTMPATPVSGIGGMRINGGRNVVLIGGQIDVPAGALLATGTHDRRGLYLRGQTGTIHVEGLRISGAGLGEGINLDQRNGARVQLQNIRVDTVTGSPSGNHADVLQTWAGPRQLLVDRLTGHTTYQGFFLLPTQQWSTAVEPEMVDLRRVDLHGTPVSGYMMWRDSRAWPLKVRDVWVAPKDPSWRDGFLWPKGTLPGSEAWPSVHVGAPASGEFVPVGTAGIGYVSPGYLPVAPVGSLERVTPADGGLRVTGWTADHDTTAPISVDLTAAGATTRVTADVARPDVQAPFPDVSSNLGFDTVLPLPAGPHEVCVTAINVESGSDTALGCLTGTVPDTAPPQFTTGPSVTPRAGRVSRDGVVPVTAAWSVTDDVGVRAVRLTSPVAGDLTADQTSAAVDVAAGTSTWALTATDEAGNAGSVSGDRTVALVPEQSATPTDYWWPAGGADCLGGTCLRTNRSGASMSHTFQGSSVAWLGMKEPAAGQAAVYLDGTRVATVDLSAPTTQYRQVLFTHDAGTVGTHTLTVVVERSPAGRTWVTSDGFVTVG